MGGRPAAAGGRGARRAVLSAERAILPTPAASVLDNVVVRTTSLDWVDDPLVALPGSTFSATAPRRTGGRSSEGMTWVRRYQRQLVALDLLAGCAAAIVAYAIRFDVSSPVAGARVVDVELALVLPLAWVCMVAVHRGYEGRFIGAGAIEFQRLSRAFMDLAVLVCLVSYLAKTGTARGFVVMSLPLVFVLDFAARYVARKRLHRLRQRGQSMTPVLAVGGPAAVADFAALMISDQYAGMSVVGACVPARPAGFDEADADRLDELGIALLGDVDSILDAVRACGARNVAVLAGEIDGEKLRWIAWQLEGSDTGLIVSPGLTEVGGRRLHIQPVAGLPLLYVDEPKFSGFHRLLKGGFDRIAASLALLVLLPVFVAIAVMIRLTSSGPALFRQTRVGLNGKRFTMFKFRSMRQGAESGITQLLARNDLSSGPLFKMRADPRVTRVGRVLRSFSLDELPQLINVLNGSMSLVGPRPPLPEEVVRYADDAHRRLLVKPGITGLWQVSGRSDLSWEQSVRLDLRYVENWSLTTDVMILWKTVFAVVKQSGAY